MAAMAGMSAGVVVWFVWVFGLFLEVRRWRMDHGKRYQSSKNISGSFVVQSPPISPLGRRPHADLLLRHRHLCARLAYRAVGCWCRVLFFVFCFRCCVVVFF